ncbi:hypothetical protein PanWU01x14_208480 [Parasponia andersonii]|uniref:Uncharacterized protein n=1 Tax=Parasponia andersonii TaxID=3476 RepID=A0A2P5BUI3_PARAD|nr:hypothetical protein PanWU01x14_208480 [Parasponia andersonii]
MAKRVVKIASFATPFLYALQYQWLEVLSFIDDFILAAEDMVERFFPPSEHVFNKIDHIVQVTETLPGKFDYAVTTFPTIVHQVPFLDWLLVHIISLLKLSITTLTQWGCQGTREKDIVVDINCESRDDYDEFVSANEDDHSTNSPVHVDSESTIKDDFPPVSESQEVETEIASVNVKTDGLKSSYKDVLEKGTAEDKEQHGKKEVTMESQRREKTRADKRDESHKNDPILALFESGWLMRRGRKGKESSVSGSVPKAL